MSRNTQDFRFYPYAWRGRKLKRRREPIPIFTGERRLARGPHFLPNADFLHGHGLQSRAKGIHTT